MTALTHLHPALTGILLALQLFVVLFLLFHDWIPLGRLNDVQAVRSVVSFRKLFITTVVSAAAYVFCLVASVIYFSEVYPEWLLWWLWCSYVFLFLGQMRAWWIPYFFIPDPERAARYQMMFRNTQSFLPPRNGIRPNTLHIIFHLVTLALLVVLGILTL
jgi:hypothetical protein